MDDDVKRAMEMKPEFPPSPLLPAYVPWFAGFLILLAGVVTIWLLR